MLPGDGRPGTVVCVAASSCVVELGRRRSVRCPELSCLPSPSDSRGFCAGHPLVSLVAVYGGERASRSLDQALQDRHITPIGMSGNGMAQSMACLRSLQEGEALAQLAQLPAVLVAASWR